MVKKKNEVDPAFSSGLPLSFQQYFERKSRMYLNQPATLAAYRKFISELHERNDDLDATKSFFENDYIPQAQLLPIPKSMIDALQLILSELAISKEIIIERLFSERGYTQRRIIQDQGTYYYCVLYNWEPKNQDDANWKCYQSDDPNMFWHIYKTLVKKVYQRVAFTRDAAIQHALHDLEKMHVYIDPKKSFDLRFQREWNTKMDQLARNMIQAQGEI